MTFYSEESERVLCCMLMIDGSLVDRISVIMSDDDLYFSLHKSIFQTVKQLYHDGIGVDLSSVCAAFSQRGENSAISEIAAINGVTFTSANAEYYVKNIKDLSLKRQTARIVDEAKQRLELHTDSAADIAGDLERDISSANLGMCGQEYRHVSTYMMDALSDIEQFIETSGKVKGVDAPFASLGEITDFRDGEYIIIAARASMGKTACALNMIEEIAVKRKIPTGMFSIEMTAKQLNLRMISSLCGFSSWMISKGLYRQKKDMDKIGIAAKDIADSPLFVDESSSMKLSELKTKLRRMVKVDGCKIVFIDYIGLINAELPRLPRHEQIAEISRSIKSMAKELNVPIVVLSQLTRDFEGKRPTLNSLAETRSLEQDADLIIFIHRQRIEDMSDEEKAKFSARIPSELIIAKNRNGPTGTAQMVYVPNITKFLDVAKLAD
jgi:replicative DNA helicase